MVIPVGESREVKIGIGGSRMKLWVARGPDWVPTVISGLSKTKYLQMTNIGDRDIILPTHTILGLWTEGDMVPRTQGFVTVESGKYKEWQTLAYEATTDSVNALPEEQIGPIIDLPEYATPKRIMKRPSDPLKYPSPAVSMVTRQSVYEELRKTDSAVVGEGKGNGAELTLHSRAELSRMDTDHKIGP